MEKRIDFTEGRIVLPLVRFVGPVFCALFLQALYGAVDLMIVGKFAESADVSAVATGSQIMMTITNLISSLAMGMTILLGQKIGERKPEEGGRIVGSGILLLGTPIALQDLLVGISFLVILAIVNSLGLIYSAGIGVAEKVCAFIMLMPAAFMQSMSAFAAQNIGAGKPDRAVRGLFSAIGISMAFGVLMFYVTFFHGDVLSGIFANDPEVIAASHDYLKAYAIDCMLTCFLFCFIGFFNGVGYTGFVMMQGIAGAFLMRVPVSFLMSRIRPVSLFRIGLATPCSSLLQITLCFICFAVWRKRQKKYTDETGSAVL